uniref:F-actin-capping protein subunit alpha n=1 Tax=Aegilops tauschii subsp. strangulata TaxID=200361 RepID=A0A453AQI8_AEGTS
EAYPEYNKTHLLSLQLPDRSGDIIITTYGEIDRNNYLDPRTAQIATVDHVKQTCTKLRPAADEELPSAYIEEFRYVISATFHCPYYIASE